MGASHLQVRQRHCLSSPTIRRPARADCRLSESAPQIARCVQQHMSTPNTWTCDGRVPYSPGPASSLPSAALRSGRSSLVRCTNPRSGPPQAPVTRRKFAYSASPTLTVWRYLCHSLGAYPGTCLARGPAKCADNPRARDRRVACSP